MPYEELVATVDRREFLPILSSKNGDFEQILLFPLFESATTQVNDRRSVAYNRLMRLAEIRPAIVARRLVGVFEHADNLNDGYTARYLYEFLKSPAGDLLVVSLKNHGDDLSNIVENKGVLIRNRNVTYQDEQRSGLKDKISGFMSALGEATSLDGDRVITLAEEFQLSTGVIRVLVSIFISQYEEMTQSIKRSDGVLQRTAVYREAFRKISIANILLNYAGINGDQSALVGTLRGKAIANIAKPNHTIKTALPVERKIQSRVTPQPTVVRSQHNTKVAEKLREITEGVSELRESSSLNPEQVLSDAQHLLDSLDTFYEENKEHFTAWHFKWAEDIRQSITDLREEITEGHSVDQQSQALSVESDDHNITALSQRKAAQDYPEFTKQFSFLEKALLTIATEYIKQSGKNHGPPEEFAIASNREGNIWNIEGEELTARRILTNAGYSQNDIDFVISQIQIHESQPTESEAIQDQIVSFGMDEADSNVAGLPGTFSEIEKLELACRVTRSILQEHQNQVDYPLACQTHTLLLLNILSLPEVNIKAKLASSGHHYCVRLVDSKVIVDAFPEGRGSDSIPMDKDVFLFYPKSKECSTYYDYFHIYDDPSLAIDKGYVERVKSIFEHYEERIKTLLSTRIKLFPDGDSNIQADPRIIHQEEGLLLPKGRGITFEDIKRSLTVISDFLMDNPSIRFKEALHYDDEKLNAMAKTDKDFAEALLLMQRYYSSHREIFIVTPNSEFLVHKASGKGLLLLGDPDSGKSFTALRFIADPASGYREEDPASEWIAGLSGMEVGMVKVDGRVLVFPFFASKKNVESDALTPSISNIAYKLTRPVELAWAIILGYDDEHIEDKLEDFDIQGLRGSCVVIRGISVPGSADPADARWVEVDRKIKDVFSAAITKEIWEEALEEARSLLASTGEVNLKALGEKFDLTDDELTELAKEARPGKGMGPLFVQAAETREWLDKETSPSSYEFCEEFLTREDAVHYIDALKTLIYDDNLTISAKALSTLGYLCTHSGLHPRSRTKLTKELFQEALQREDKDINSVIQSLIPLLDNLLSDLSEEEFKKNIVPLSAFRSIGNFIELPEEFFKKYAAFLSKHRKDNPWDLSFVLTPRGMLLPHFDREMQRLYAELILKFDNEGKSHLLSYIFGTLAKKQRIEPECLDMLLSSISLDSVKESSVSTVEALESLQEIIKNQAKLGIFQDESIDFYIRILKTRRNMRLLDSAAIDLGILAKIMKTRGMQEELGKIKNEAIKIYNSSSGTKKHRLVSALIEIGHSVKLPEKVAEEMRRSEETLSVIRKKLKAAESYSSFYLKNLPKNEKEDNALMSVLDEKDIEMSLSAISQEGYPGKPFYVVRKGRWQSATISNVGEFALHSHPYKEEKDPDEFRMHTIGSLADVKSHDMQSWPLYLWARCRLWSLERASDNIDIDSATYLFVHEDGEERRVFMNDFEEQENILRDFLERGGKFSIFFKYWDEGIFKSTYEPGLTLQEACRAKMQTDLTLDEKRQRDLDNWELGGMDHTAEKAHLGQGIGEVETIGAENWEEDDEGPTAESVNPIADALMISDVLLGGHIGGFYLSADLTGVPFNVMITYKCPLNCGHCFAKEALVRGGFKDAEKDALYSVFDQLSGMEEVYLVGSGEPLAYGKKKLFKGNVSSDFLDIVRYAATKVRTVNIVTNAYLVPENIKDAERFFAQFPKNVRWVVSVDEHHQKELAKGEKKSLVKIVKMMEKLAEKDLIETAYNVRLGDKQTLREDILVPFGLEAKYRSENMRNREYAPRTIFVNGIIAEGNAKENEIEGSYEIDMGDIHEHAHDPSEFFPFIDPEGNIVLSDHFAFSPEEARMSLAEKHLQDKYMFDDEEGRCEAYEKIKQETDDIDPGKELRTFVLGNISDGPIFETIIDRLLSSNYFGGIPGFLLKDDNPENSFQPDYINRLTDEEKKHAIRTLVRSIIHFRQGDIAKARQTIDSMDLSREGVRDLVFNILFFLSFYSDYPAYLDIRSFSRSCLEDKLKKHKYEHFIPEMDIVLRMLEKRKGWRTTFYKFFSFLSRYESEDMEYDTVLFPSWIKNPDPDAHFHCPVYEFSSAKESFEKYIHAKDEDSFVVGGYDRGRIYFEPRKDKKEASREFFRKYPFGETGIFAAQLGVAYDRATGKWYSMRAIPYTGESIVDSLWNAGLKSLELDAIERLARFAAMLEKSGLRLKNISLATIEENIGLDLSVEQWLICDPDILSRGKKGLLPSKAIMEIATWYAYECHRTEGMPSLARKRLERLTRIQISNIEETFQEAYKAEMASSDTPVIVLPKKPTRKTSKNVDSDTPRLYSFPGMFFDPVFWKRLSSRRLLFLGASIGAGLFLGLLARSVFSEVSLVRNTSWILGPVFMLGMVKKIRPSDPSEKITSHVPLSDYSRNLQGMSRGERKLKRIEYLLDSLEKILEERSLTLDYQLLGVLHGYHVYPENIDIFNSKDIVTLELPRSWRNMRNVFWQDLVDYYTQNTPRLGFHGVAIEPNIRAARKRIGYANNMLRPDEDDFIVLNTSKDNEYTEKELGGESETTRTVEEILSAIPSELKEEFDKKGVTHVRSDQNPFGEKHVVILAEVDRTVTELIEKLKESLTEEFERYKFTDQMATDFVAYHFVEAMLLALNDYYQTEQALACIRKNISRSDLRDSELRALHIGGLAHNNFLDMLLNRSDQKRIRITTEAEGRLLLNPDLVTYPAFVFEDMEGILTHIWIEEGKVVVDTDYFFDYISRIIQERPEHFRRLMLEKTVWKSRKEDDSPREEKEKKTDKSPDDVAPDMRFFRNRYMFSKLTTEEMERVFKYLAEQDWLGEHAFVPLVVNTVLTGMDARYSSIKEALNDDFIWGKMLEVREKLKGSDPYYAGHSNMIDESGEDETRQWWISPQSDPFKDPEKLIKELYPEAPEAHVKDIAEIVRRKNIKDIDAVWEICEKWKSRLGAVGVGKDDDVDMDAPAPKRSNIEETFQEAYKAEMASYLSITLLASMSGFIANHPVISCIAALFVSLNIWRAISPRSWYAFYRKVKNGMNSNVMFEFQGAVLSMPLLYLIEGIGRILEGLRLVNSKELKEFISEEMRAGSMPLEKSARRLKRIGASSKEMIEAYEFALSSTSQEVRNKAAALLANIGNKSSIEAIADNISKEGAYEVFIQALEKLDAPKEEMILANCSALLSKEDETRKKAARALDELGATKKDKIAGYFKAVFNRKGYRLNMGEVKKTLIEWGISDSELFDLYIKLLSSSNSFTRNGAAERLIKAGNKKRLVELFGDEYISILETYKILTDYSGDEYKGAAFKLAGSKEILDIVDKAEMWSKPPMNVYCKLLPLARHAWEYRFGAGRNESSEFFNRILPRLALLIANSYSTEDVPLILNIVLDRIKLEKWTETKKESYHGFEGCPNSYIEELVEYEYSRMDLSGAWKLIKKPKKLTAILNQYKDPEKSMRRIVYFARQLDTDDATATRYARQNLNLIAASIPLELYEEALGVIFDDADVFNLPEERMNQIADAKSFLDVLKENDMPTGFALTRSIPAAVLTLKKAKREEVFPLLMSVASELAAKGIFPCRCIEISASSIAKIVNLDITKVPLALEVLGAFEGKWAREIVPKRKWNSRSEEYHFYRKILREIFPEVVLAHDDKEAAVEELFELVFEEIEGILARGENVRIESDEIERLVRKIYPDAPKKHITDIAEIVRKRKITDPEEILKIYDGIDNSAGGLERLKGIF